ncbi:hypothetical protein [Vibrio coralliilyticus]|nr:hypothetical protein [Vibrio coralliilyticus]
MSIEWKLHTLIRPSEVAGAKWNEVNLEAQAWTILFLVSPSRAIS